MRPKKHTTTGSGDLFRARLDQIINMKHELVLLAGKVDWDWIDGEIAPLYSENGRPGIATRFMIGLLLLKHIYGLSDEGGANPRRRRSSKQSWARKTASRKASLISCRASPRLLAARLTKIRVLNWKEKQSA